MKEYVRIIGGQPHTVLMDEQEAASLGLEESRPRVPIARPTPRPVANKARRTRGPKSDD